ncbi:SDR family oxidoreductase (plasmid) [Mesorhizobium sp. AR02]|uniref:SDR family oxidoreductase n=1 Tax=Mesorhizobium sp. AR02 TaxID=2865837 RepID=UPI00215E7216|nr:SDR family oxidoreductase [Mesorhizobium sp. AR02]UVK57305.1 SDR family oxidoreductase [Mesorhizobium sp. AR02]
MAQSLQGKSVLVTGASSGIGRAAARAFAHEGMRVVLSARSHDKLGALADELGSNAIVIPADLTVPAEVDRLVAESIRRLDGIDVLFANAGVYVAGQVAQGDADEWDRLLMLNVNSVFRAIRAALPHMQARKSGDILVTSSISAHQALHFEPVYSASKHAVNAFVHGLRRQLIPDNIRVGSIAPGTVLNELWGFHDPAQIERKVADRSGLRSEDVAEAAIFMLTRPANVTIRDLVILPQALDL